MGLTDASLLWLLVGLAVLAGTAVVVGWRRLAGPGPWRVLGRVGALLGTNLLVLVVAFVVLNDSYLFYSGWADLFGSLHTTVVTQQAGAASVPAGPARVRPQAPSGGRLPPDPRSHALVTTYTVTGAKSGITAPVLVVLPPGYFAAGNTNRRYPVIEGFPAYPGSIYGVPADFSVRSVDASLVAAHAIGPVIWVVPTTSVPPGSDTECVNGPPGSTQAATWVTHDVPAWLQQHFRVQQQRTSWATFGMSAGGWCAASSAFLDPARYGAAIALGGYFRPQWSNWIPFPSRSAAYRRYDLVARAGVDPPPIALFVYTSRQDPESYPTTSAMLAAATAPLAVTADVASGGGHRLATWTPVFPKALTWLGANLAGFAPTR